MRTLFRLKLGFYFSSKSCFPPRAWTFLVSSTLLPLFDCGDVFLFGRFQEMSWVFGYCGTAVSRDLLLAKNVFLPTAPCMQRRSGHLWMYPGINTGWVLFINLSLTWCLLIYLDVSKASKASIARALVMSVRWVWQSWVEDHSVSLPVLSGTHSKMTSNSSISSVLRPSAPSQTSNSPRPSDTVWVF